MSAPDSRLQLSHLLKPTVRGSVSTDLDSVISGIPWGDAFTLGSGIDAITGSVTNSAVMHFTPSRTPIKNLPKMITKRNILLAQEKDANSPPTNTQNQTQQHR